MNRGWFQSGDKNPKRKLTEAQVLILREMRRCGEPLTSAAKEFGVHHSTAYRAAVGMAWRYIPSQ
jgi:hypothetical protein